MFVRRSKFRSPELVPGSIARRDVETRLAPDVRALSLVAGPGYGKTIVAVRLYEACGGPKLWYSFDPTDADAAVFAARIDAELDVLGAQRLPDVETGRLGSAKEIGSYLAERIASLRPAPLFAFDDLHEIEGGSATDAVTELVLRATGLGATFVLSGRTMPVALHRIAAATRLVRVGQDELVFDERETADYLSRALGGNGDLGVVRLVAQAEGWPAGLALIASTARIPRRGDVAFAVARPEESRRRLFAYLAREVLEAVSDRERHVLLETSILEEVDAALADSLLERADSAEVLASLAKRNLFVLRLSEDAFKVHGLFREFLVEALRSTRSEAHVRALHVRAADAFRLRGDRRRSIAHRLAARAVEEAAREFEACALEMLRAGAVSAVAGLLDGLPPSRVRSSSALSTAQGRVLWQRGRADEAFETLERAIALARKAGDFDLAAEAVRVLAPILGSRGALEQLRDMLEEALAFAPLREDSAAGLRTTLGAVDVDTARYDEALAIFRDITPFLVAEGDVATQSSVLHNTAVAHHRRGDLFAALSTYERALVMKERSGQRLSALVTLGDLVYIRTLLGDAEEAAKLAQRLLAGALDFGSSAMLARAHEARGALALQRGDVATAEAEYDAAFEATGAGDVLVLPYVLHGRAQCALAKKRYVEAQERCVEAERIFRDAGRIQRTAPVLVTRAAVALAGRNVVEAALHARAAAAAAASGTDAVLTAAASLDAAELLVKCAERSFGDERDAALAGAREAAAHALALVHERDYHFLLRTKAAAFARIEPYLERGRATAAREPAAEFRPSSLRISLFGEFRVVLDGERLPEERWKRRKAREIFTYLVARRKSAVSREKILAMYWPGVDAERANDALRVTISAIRKTVGNVVKYEASAYRFAPLPGTVIDVVEFEDAIDAGRNAAAAGDDASAHSAYGRALDLYAADFLDGSDDGGWEWRDRERLRAAVLEAARRLATEHSVASVRRRALRRWLAIAPFDLAAVAVNFRTLAGEAGIAVARYEYETWRARYRDVVGMEAPDVDVHALGMSGSQYAPVSIAAST